LLIAQKGAEQMKCRLEGYGFDAKLNQTFHLILMPENARDEEEIKKLCEHGFALGIFDKNHKIIEASTYALRR
jgi:hypothetical protein